MLELQEKSRILIVAAHPDDEILGLGASMHKIINEKKCTVQVIILGEGITSRSDKHDPEKWKKELKIHRNNIEAVKNIIGFEKVNIYNFPDNRFDTLALLDIVKVVEKEISDFQPDVILTHFKDDLNIDHKITYQSVITACRPGTNSVRTIICFETPSTTEWNTGIAFIPNLWVEISEENLNAKQKAMDCYEFEKRSYPHPRSGKALRSLAEKRGIEIGLEMAEAFILIRTQAS